jgi:hypothetical protein
MLRWMAGVDQEEGRPELLAKVSVASMAFAESSTWRPREEDGEVRWPADVPLAWALAKSTVRVMELPFKFGLGRVCRSSGMKESIGFTLIQIKRFIFCFNAKIML